MEILKTLPQNRLRQFVAGVVAAVTLLLAATSNAHEPDQSYVFLRVYDDAMLGRVEISIADLNEALALGLPEDGSVTAESIRSREAMIRSFLTEHVAVAPDAEPTPVEISNFELHMLGDTQYLHGFFSFADLDGKPEVVNVDYSVLFDKKPSHRGFAVVEHNWSTGTFNDESNIMLVFRPGAERQSFEVEGSVLQGFAAMIGQGAHHIWIGIDHILFLLALLLPSVVRRESGQWQPVDGFRPAIIYVIKVVTVFTIAHTITLSAAALGAISLPSRLVESIIALSIAVAALDIVRQIFGRRIWWVVFVFGLFHGFGFASVLGDIGIGGEYLFHTLFGFNLGVELGQVAVVAVVFPLLFLIRRLAAYPRILLPGGALLLIAISLYWFVERGFDIDLPAGRLLKPVLSLFT